mgnify:CR=1 FL=1
MLLMQIIAKKIRQLFLRGRKKTNSIIGKLGSPRVGSGIETTKKEPIKMLLNGELLIQINIIVIMLNVDLLKDRLYLIGMMS